MNSNFFNLTKRKKRDVLSELLADKSFEGLVSKKELNTLNKLISDTPHINSSHNKQTEKTKKTTLGKKKRESKKKTTLYLSEEVFENLESATNEIRTIVPENLRARVSQSQIVNQALILILKEYEARGKNSMLFRSIIQKN
jgi:hypothetical protein